jgi:inosine-uridine nucleoside N-ribohydrolase
MIGLDVTTKVRLNEAVLSRVRTRNKRFGPFLYAITRFYEDFHRKGERVMDGFYVHDPSALMYLMVPELFATKEGPVRVVREGVAIGQTIMAAYDHHLELSPWKDQPRVKVVIAFDRERFEKTLEAALTGDQTP